MIERAKARSQVKRLSMLLGFPRDSEDAMTDLIDAVQCAATDKQAEDCIAAFLDTSEADSRCPLAPALRRWIYDHQDASKQRVAGCPHCKGTGYLIVERGGLTGAKDCECRKMTA